MPSTLLPNGIERPPEDVDYPDSDGKPMGETDAHVDLIIQGKDVLMNYYAGNPDVYVAGNNFICYEQGNNKARVSPDGYVVLGVPMKQRNSYKVWEEGGKMPSVVFEYTSRGTRREDEGYKRTLYEQVLRVPEYFLFDPKGEYLRPRLQGYRLTQGKYINIPLVNNRLFSEQLNLFLTGEGTALRFINAVTGELLRTHAEDIAILAAAELHAQEEAQNRIAAERRAEEAEAKLARLIAELEALKQQRP